MDFLSGDYIWVHGSRIQGDPYMKKTVDILSRFVEGLKLGINPPSKVNRPVSTSDMYDRDVAPIRVAQAIHR